MSRAFVIGALLAAAVAGGGAPARAHGVTVTVSGGSPPPADPAKRPVVIGPQPVFVVPYVCFLPGYWAYQWVGQTYAYSVWVPGQWSAEGTWVEGHYEPRTYMTGYYQPVWIEGRRIAC